MKTVKITRQTFVKGSPVKPGKTFEVPKDISETEAGALIHAGKAVPADGGKENDEDRAKDGTGESRR